MLPSIPLEVGYWTWKNRGKFSSFGKNNIFECSVQMWAILYFLRWTYKGIYSMSVNTEAAIMILSSFPPHCFLIPYTVMAASDIIQVTHFFCEQSFLQKRVSTFTQDMQYWSLFCETGQSEREYKLRVQGLFQLSLNCSCLWGWAQLWNKHHHSTMCQDEEGIHCPSEKRTSYELNYSNGCQPVHLGLLTGSKT